MYTEQLQAFLTGGNKFLENDPEQPYKRNDPNTVAVQSQQSPNRQMDTGGRGVEPEMSFLDKMKAMLFNNQMTNKR